MLDLMFSQPQIKYTAVSLYLTQRRQNGTNSLTAVKL